VTIEGKLRCVFISWPEVYAGYARPRARDNAWHGSLLQDKSDASGLSYRRNRYYDPAAGRFTREDPTGLAGGLNVYGFANGDPVSYSDPYGLSAQSDTIKASSNTDPVERHGRCEVAGILSNYTSALRTNPVAFAPGRGRGFPSQFDFKFGPTGNDLYQVGERWIRADEFGNFAAGYAAQHALREPGWLAMLAGGVYFAWDRSSGEHWSDRESRPMINAGAGRSPGGSPARRDDPPLR
jgi:RHS repeat-associated protein